MIIKIEDHEWAKVDIDDVKYVNDATEHSCSGAYICGTLTTRFIPHHFTFVDSNITNNNGNLGTFTYMANLNPTDPTTFSMAARLTTKIEARNKSEGITQNFRAGTNLYENPIDVNISVHDNLSGDANTTRIINSLIGFTAGAKTIEWDETNTSQVLRFNFPRVVNDSINPFDVNRSELNLSINSRYTGTALSSPVDINGTKENADDGNVTFIYGRTHASRQRYEVPTDAPYRANIYYEAYCFGTDSTTNDCNKTLLPNGVNSNRTDDRRWFINTSHMISRDGNITAIAVNEKAPNNHVIENLPNRDESVNHISTIELVYDENQGYPYRTTMENNASEWLIYNEDNASAVKNYFSAEFYKIGVGWSGEHETNTTTKDPGTATTNRRSMW